MPEVVQNGDSLHTVEGLDPMELSREELPLRPTAQPLLDTSQGDIEVPTSPNRDPTGNEETRLAESAVDMALRSAPSEPPTNRGQGDKSPTQVARKREAFSSYKKPRPVDAVCER